MIRPVSRHPRLWTAIALASAGLSLPAAAEIILLEGGQVISAEPGYIYQHPSLRSVVFVTPEARQMAILPPAPVFIPTPPLLWRAPYSPVLLYPPASVARGVNASTRPSNQDMASYHLQRSHAFSMDLYNRNTYLSVGSNPNAFWYGYGAYGTYGAYGPGYPPPVVGGGFNQGAHPSNQDMVIYNIQRAHSFSMDAYKKP